MAENTKSNPQAASRGNYAQINGLNMYYEIHGEGEPLLILHGGFATIGMFFNVLPRLSAGRQVIAVELQGHGHTADIERDLRFEYIADDIAALLKHLSIKQTDVFGYSFGGTVALYLAAQHPQLVRKLALASAVYSPEGYLPDILEGLRHATPDGFPPIMREEYERVAPDPQGWPRLIAKAANQISAWQGLRPEEVQAIKAPALVLVADGDIIRHEHTQELSRLLQANLVVLSNSDHASYMVASSEELLAHLSSFLNAPVQEGK
ncbi:alpha/beta hydrolase [Ktedonosporobacter rubrisoli]|uniref:Alpha/beta hydrolase n=1 Tax=Ktedonosporobacter rubrisoli TaxID=2509675 RepID=A0A4P6JJ00_KTERU|nr:alpha/beta hydrolase [Ktedonosporobacter rubrisoli]QBD75077.1 alpha/beta hydrolase [Ktedonosporobacter rubrisoli]